jgi:hypothetical protein
MPESLGPAQTPFGRDTVFHIAFFNLICRIANVIPALLNSSEFGGVFATQKKQIQV